MTLLLFQMLAGIGSISWELAKSGWATPDSSSCCLLFLSSSYAPDSICLPIFHAQMLFYNLESTKKISDRETPEKMEYLLQG